jgi:hypothetical protein
MCASWGKRRPGQFFMQPEPKQVNQILEAIGAGDPQGAEKLLPLVYEELRRLAAAKMAHIAPGQTLQPTALLDEAWLCLVESQQQPVWNSRGHFFAGTTAMNLQMITKAPEGVSGLIL